jgi:predicted DNA-binding transcriptional regulator AlpA
MPTDNDALDAIKLLSLKQVAAAVGRSPDTINQWCREGFFPKPLQARPGAPKQWRMKTVADWIEKRARARYTPPSPRGAIRRGEQLRRRKSAD